MTDDKTDKLESESTGEAGRGLLDPPMDPTEVTDMFLAVQVEKLRVSEALAARDNVVIHLENAYVSVRQKAATILRLEQELDVFKRASTPANTNPVSFESVLKLPSTPQSDPGHLLEEGDVTQTDHLRAGPHTPQRTPSAPPYTPEKLVDSFQSNSAYSRAGFTNSSALIREPYTPTQSDDEESRGSAYTHSPSRPQSSALRVPIPAREVETTAEQMISARRAMLTALPLPPDIPDDSLQPILIHSSCTLHEFLENTSGSLRDLLKNYRILSQLTTYWCPEREEHGYFLTPVFKCSTNPRIATAHRWSSVDVIGQMNSPTECFYNKDGKWYYAGTYVAFRMEDLTVQEWEALSTETTQAIIRETLANRKNVSPQNHYEIAQLYAAGALRVACVGLQCVGFSDAVYRGVLEQSRLGYWGRSPAWTPARTTITRIEARSDDAKPVPP